MSSPKDLMIIINFINALMEILSNKEKGCRVGKESKLGTNEEV
jgi:hypothetical protein